MALNQKRVITNFSISTSEEKHEFEEEYESMCAQVVRIERASLCCYETFGLLTSFFVCKIQDKVTLQLYRAMVEAGKLERALDLVHRLHLEKSFDIAITMADRLNHRNLSDRIENVKDRWLSLIDADQPADEEDDLVAERADDDEEEEEDDEDFGNNQYDSIDLERDVGAGKSNSLNLTENAAGPIRRISPDSHRAFKRPFDQVGEERMSKNPFTKKRLESPAHKSNLITSTSPKRKISRASTFSTKSREKNRASKNFL
jgi:chromosome transmission fidelity protein 4